MTKTDLVEGSATLEDFFYFINERHRIWCTRKKGEPWPWTEDKILQEWKFTNVFRELDKGTLALRQMISKYRKKTGSRLISEPLIYANIAWYRIFNRYEHAASPGFVTNPELLRSVFTYKQVREEPVFTGAHMTWAPKGDKLECYLQLIEAIFDEKMDVFYNMTKTSSLEDAFNYLMSRGYKGIGPFLAYEIISDMRFEIMSLRSTKDRLLWANIGPGCERGLRRLGLKPCIRSLRYLYGLAWEGHKDNPEATRLAPRFQLHHVGACNWNEETPKKPFFELREIEHSLCEFDKYMRVKTGAGKPRSRYVPPKG